MGLLAIAGLSGGAEPAHAQEPPLWDTLRILAYNTHHGEGTDGVLSLIRIGEVISGAAPDLVALQEVDRRVERTGWVDQAAEYGTLTGLESTFGGFMDYQGGHYGMAILSRHPILEQTNHRLPGGSEPRTALEVRVCLPRSGKEVALVGIHLYRTEEERLAQARTLMGALHGNEGLIILAGDFNSTPGSPVMELLSTRWTITPKSGPSLTYPSPAPSREIDFVLLPPDSGVRVLEHRVLDEDVASDHRPVFIVLEIR
jgi:endonuclease/exonuclease/phosphatase family metal-dependent hydrolase